MPYKIVKLVFSRSFILRFFLMALVCAILYLFLWPVPVDPEVFNPEVGPAMEGDYSVNIRLQNIEIWHSENLFGPEYAEFLELMGEVRKRVIRDVPDRETRRRIFECLINSDILELVAESIGQKAESGERQELHRLIEERIAQCMLL